MQHIYVNWARTTFLVKPDLNKLYQTDFFSLISNSKLWAEECMVHNVLLQGKNSVAKNLRMFVTTKTKTNTATSIKHTILTQGMPHSPKLEHNFSNLVQSITRTQVINSKPGLIQYWHQYPYGLNTLRISIFQHG